jgi:hypothetical protein
MLFLVDALPQKPTKEELEFIPQVVDFFESKELFHPCEALIVKGYVNIINNLAVDESSWEVYLPIVRRMITLLRVNGDHRSNEIVPGVHVFNHLSFPGYEASNVIFLKYPNLAVQRLQLSGLCSLHAPAVLHFYLSSMRYQQREKMLNIVGFVRDSFSKAELKKHIFENEGGNSVRLLRRLLGLADSCVVNCHISDIVSHYDRYGPALVSQFQVHDDFCSLEQFFHYGSPTGECKGRYHAMVLAGYRKDKNGNIYYLLQNWWKEKQFVEVSPAYLQECGVLVYFVTVAVEPLDDSCPSIDGSFSFYESEAVDLPESYCPEW